MVFWEERAMKKLIINGSECEYIKLEKSIEFLCSRCKKKKISKKYAQYQIGGVTKKLCNGCYGSMLAQQNKNK